MGSVSTFGLGLMGAALARTMRAAGHNVVVWNRSPERMQAFRDTGFACTSDLQSAITASPVLVICIDNYTSIRSLFSPPEIAVALRGKVIVQLSSSTPKEAFEASERTHLGGASYLDGAILAGPGTIGTAKATILLSGDEVAYAAARLVLDCLGQGTVRYLGTNVGAASALDLAWLTTRYGNFVAGVHAANLCQAEGVPVNELMALVPDNPAMQTYLQVIHAGSFDDYTASLKVWAEALEHIRQQGRDASINMDFPDFVAGLFNRAIASGYGQKNVMSLIKVLQDRPSPDPGNNRHG